MKLKLIALFLIFAWTPSLWAPPGASVRIGTEGVLTSAEQRAIEHVNNAVTAIAKGPIEEAFVTTRYSTIEAFAEALATGGDNEEALYRLLGEIDRSEETISKFIYAIEREAERNPQAYESMLSSLQRLEKYRSDVYIPKPSIGGRALNSGLFAAGIVSFLYSFVSAYTQPGAEHAFNGMSDMTSKFILMHFGIAVITEIKALKVTLPSFFAELRMKSRVRSHIRDLRSYIKLLSGSKLTVSAREWLAKRNYVSRESLRAERIAEKVNAVKAGIAEPELETRLSRLERQGWVDRGSKLWSAIVSLSSDLTETEKSQIRRAIENPGTSMEELLPYQSKLAFFEEKVRRILSESGFYVNPNLRSEILASLLKLQGQQRVEIIKSSAMNARNALANTSLGIGVTIMGVMASIGVNEMPIDASFGVELIHWIRAHSDRILQFAGLFVLPSAANFWWQYSSWLNKKRIGPRFDSQVEALKRVVQREMGEANALRFDLSEISVRSVEAERLIEKLIDVAQQDSLPFSCRRAVKGR